MSPEESSLPEIIFSIGESPAVRKQIQRLVDQNHLFKIRDGIYTPKPKNDWELVVLNHWREIVAHLFPNGVIGFSSAFYGGMPRNGKLFITHKYHRIEKLPGLTIYAYPGIGPQADDMPFVPVPPLYLSSEPRQFLENSSRDPKKLGRSVPQAELTDRLIRIRRRAGEERLNKIRDRIKELAFLMKTREKSQEKINQIIGTILGTSSSDLAKDDHLLSAYAKKTPYDRKRIALFENVGRVLSQLPYSSSSSPDVLHIESLEAKKNMAFWESYFSNFIEGTEFEVDVAADIVFKGKVPSPRPQDAHDIKATYEIILKDLDDPGVPLDPSEFLDTIKQLHSLIMSARPDILPGQWKNIRNRVGTYEFVDPNLVEETLRLGFMISQSVPEGLPRATYLMFLVAEVHPFIDGNGRIARLVLNSELYFQERSRIIIPTLARTDSLGTLQKASKKGDPEALFRFFQTMKQFTSRLPFASFESTQETLKDVNAFERSIRDFKLGMPGSPSKSSREHK